MKLFIEFGCFVFLVIVLKVTDCWGSSRLAESPGKKPSASEKAQWLYVTEIDTNIYEKPDFDSKILGLAPMGSKLRASAQTYGGFYKVLIQPGKVGYVSDAEVSPNAPLEDSSEENAPSLSPRLGIGYEWVNYKEETRGLVFQESLSGILFDFSNPYAKLQFLAVPKAPNFYERFGTSRGFLLMTRAYLLTDFEALNLGFGPQIKYSNYHVGSLNLENIVIGLDLMGSYKINIAGNWMVEPGFSYHFEKKQYLSIFALINRAL